MSISKVLVLGCISLIISGCQSWQFRDVDSLPPTAALPQTSEPGVVEARYWNNVSGTSVSSLTTLPGFPENPDEIIQLTELRGPTNQGDSYGVLVRGFIIPPADGQYRFFVNGDDETQFWLSPSTDAAGATKVASVPRWASLGDYTKYPEQTSQLIEMNSGQKYYFEILFKEGSGADHYSVAWEGPSLSQQVIESNHIASLGQALYPDDQATKTAYSLGYRVGFFDGSQDLSFDPGYPPEDNDQDGLYDSWEVAHRLDPNNPADKTTDPDDDLLTAADEFLIGTAENNPDTDGDGIPDGVEFAYGLDPRNPADALMDMDADGFTNLAEYQAGTSLDDPADTPMEEPVYLPGFVGQYFTGTDFANFVRTRHDGTVNFSWGTGQPMPELPIDSFSIRWSGLFTPPHTSGSREYRLTTRTDDGVRLYLDGNPVINQWRDQGATSYSHTLALGANSEVPLTMEYYESGGAATALLTITDLTTGETVSQDTAVRTPDPADTSTADKDRDGIPDTWEIRHGLSPWIDDASGISNAQGITNLQAFESGLDPWTLEPVATPSDSPTTTEPAVEEPTRAADGTATLSWTAPLTRADGSSISLSEIASYRIYYGQSAQGLDQTVTVDGSETSTKIEGLASGTWYFAIQVIDTDGLKSPLSEPVEHTVQ
ncbi:PA14 domain-containing protein [Marinobacter sp.]|uniref:PA14 domain-containing protein n=1 Tax=Marinobacter sp. TaxID=50741 RepID=UPI00384D732F